MFPHHRQTAWISLTRFGIALLAVAAAQFALIFSSFAVDAAEGGLYVTDLASGSVIVLCLGWDADDLCYRSH